MLGAEDEAARHEYASARQQPASEAAGGPKHVLKSTGLTSRTRNGRARLAPADDTDVIVCVFRGGSSAPLIERTARAAHNDDTRAAG